MNLESLKRHADLTAEDRAQLYIDHARVRVHTARVQLVAFVLGAVAGFLAGALMLSLIWR